MYYRIKRKVYDILRDHEEPCRSSTIFDLVIITLVILTMLTIILQTFNGIPDDILLILQYIQAFTAVVFTIEYSLRIWTSNYLYPNLKPFRARLKYIFSFNAMIDFLAIFPYYIPYFIPIDFRIFRTIRILRLLQILKITKYTDALHSLTSVLKKKAPQLISSWLIVLILMIIASVLMYDLENPAQPEVFQDALSGLWWAIATFTTVGYGDIYPITALGKLLGALITLLGVALVAIPTGIISAGFIEDSSKNIEKEERSQQYVPPKKRK